MLHSPQLRSAAQPASFSWVNLIFGSDTTGELQDLLEKIAHEFIFDKVARIVAATHGCYEAAEPLPLLDKMEAFLQIIQEQRARHLQRRGDMAADTPTGLPGSVPRRAATTSPRAWWAMQPW